MFINWICHTNSKSDFFCIPEFLKRTFKPVFWVQIIFWICVLVVWMHRGYFLFKRVVWYVCIKAFWYTKHIFIGNNININSLYNPPRRLIVIELCHEIYDNFYPIIIMLLNINSKECDHPWRVHFLTKSFNLDHLRLF